MKKTISYSLLSLSKSEPLLNIVYVFLQLSCWAKDDPKTFENATDPDLGQFRNALDNGLSKYLDSFGTEIKRYLNSLQNPTLEALYKLVHALKHDFSVIEPEIRFLIERHNRKLPLSHCPYPLIELIQTVVKHYWKDKCFSSIYDFNARSGELISAVSRLQQGRNAGLSYSLDESIPLMQQIGSMLLHLGSINHVEFRNQNSLTNASILKKKAQYDCVLSYPRLSINLDDKESDSDKPYILAAVNKAEKINSPEALYMQLADYCLTPSGMAFIIVTDGFLYRQGYDCEVRKYLLEQDLIEAVISLPNNLYSSTTLSTSLIILNKDKRTPGTIKLINDSTQDLCPESINKVISALDDTSLFPFYCRELIIDLAQNELVKNQFSLRPMDYLVQERLSYLVNYAQEQCDFEKVFETYQTALDKWKKS